MSVYYVANNGNDNNDGLSPATPWQTISKVNACHQGGDKILFKRGDTFYGTIESKSGIDLSHPTVYSSYGEGNKPVVSQYKTVKKGAWEQVSDNVYRVDLYDENNYIGNRLQKDKNVGFLEIDGKIFYKKKFALDELAEQWDFYCNDYDSESPFVYVYSVASPDAMCDTFSAACNIHGSYLKNYLRFENLNFTGMGGHGICESGKQVVISHCEFHRIGGSCLISHWRPNTRYGNGVEAWSDSSDILVEHCRFSDIYDVAMTMQGTPVHTSWENIYFRYNTVWNCVQAFEVWSAHDGDFAPDTGFVNCRFEYNTCMHTGYCWGYEARPNKECSAHLLMYSLCCPRCDVHVCHNLFYGARVSSIFKRNGPQEIPDDYKIYDNTFVKAADQPIALPDASTTSEELAAFEAKIAANNRIVELPLNVD